MFLKFISISELDFYTSWSVGWNKIKNLNKFDKYMTLFWLLGPFIIIEITSIFFNGTLGKNSIKFCNVF